MLILRVCFIMVSSITSFDENLTYYSISSKEHSNSYNFSDIDDPVINFLYLFFFFSSKKVYIKCIFSIINYQPPSDDGYVEITDNRIWSTGVYSYFSTIL